MMPYSGHAQGWHSMKTSDPTDELRKTSTRDRASSLSSPQMDSCPPPSLRGREGQEDLRAQGQRLSGTPGAWARPVDSDLAPHTGETPLCGAPTAL